MGTSNGGTIRRCAVGAGAVVALLSPSHCGSVPADPRQAVVASVLERADDAFLRARTVLVEGKYSLMTTPGISFFRGALPLYIYDTENGTGGLGPSRFAVQVPLVPCVGDPHPENFGTLLASDGTVAVELDDFDTADRAPYLFDVRRFAAGIALAAHLANTGDATANAATSAAAMSIARAGIEGYVAGIQGAAEGNPPARVVAPTGSAFLDQLLAKALMASKDREELTEETVQDATGRHLVRGVVDSDDPQNVFGTLPDFAVAALPAVLETYRQTLVNPPPPEYFTVLDAVREYGAGVASWPKLRSIVLIQGASSDPFDNELLEVKELTDSGIAGLYPPGLYTNDVVERDILLSRAAWARPDADFLWAGSYPGWEGFPVQIRHESEAARGVKVKDMVGDLGTVEVLTDLARVLGTILARLHSAPLNGDGGNASALWAVISTDVNGFEDEQATVGEAYAEQMLADYTRFQSALQSLGLTLGITPGPLDAPPPDEAALLGTSASFPICGSMPVSPCAPPPPPPPTPPSTSP